MVFASYAPIVHEPDARPSGIIIRLSEDGSKVTVLSPEGTGATYVRSEIMNQPILEAGALIIIERYWPDFAMNHGRPATVSNVPNNPAALVRISKLQGGENAKPSLEIAPTKGGITYEIRRGGQRPRNAKR